MKNLRPSSTLNSRKRFWSLRSFGHVACNHKKAAVLLAGSSLLATGAYAQNTSETVANNAAIASPGPSLTAGATYGTGGTAPTGTTDIVFSNQTYLQTVFNGTGLTAGSINDQSATALTITTGNTGTVTSITLNGGDSVSGDTGDLLYVATGGNLTINGGTANKLAVVLGNSGNFDVAGTGSLTISAALSGANNLTKTGAGTVILSGTNAAGVTGNGTFAGFSGNVTISAGTLQVGSNGATGDLGTGVNTITNNGTLAFNRTGTLAVTNLIAGTGAVTKLASGTVTLTGANTYSGTTTITAGTLQLGNGGTTGSLANTSAIVNNATLAFNRTDNLVQGTDFSTAAITGTGALTQAGTGTLTLNAANTFSGATTVSAGTLNLASTLAIQNSTLTAPTVGALTFDSSVASNAFTLGGLSGAGNITLANNAATPAAVALTVGNNNGSTTYSGVLSGAGSLVKVGTGTLTLSGANSYSGTTAINAGTVDIGFLANLPNSGVGTSVASGATLALAVGGNTNDVTTVATLMTNASFASGSSLGLDTAGGNFSYPTNMSGGIGLAKLGANTLTLTGANTYTGPTTIVAGTLLANGAGTLSTGSRVTFTGTATLSILSDGAGGNGGTIAQGNNISISGGGTETINVGNVSGAAGPTGNTVALGALAVGSGNTINFTGSNGYPVSFTSLALQGGSGGATTLVPTTTSVSILGNVTNPGTGTNVFAFDTLNLNGTSTGNSIAGVISDTTTGAITYVAKGSTGTWALGGANTFTGGLSITGGILSVSVLADAGVASGVGKSGQLLPFSTSASLTLNGGTLQYTGPTVATNRSIGLQTSSSIDASGTGAVTFNNAALNYNGNTSAKTLTLTGTNTAANGLSAVIANNTGATSVTKSGTGTWQLTGASTYTGPTTISAGTLVFNGAATAAATGAVNVNAGALMGTGTTPNGLLTVASGANLAPGLPTFGGTTSATTATTPGVLKVGALTLGTGSNLNILLNEGATPGTEVAGTNYSQVSSSGAVTLAGNLNLSLGGNLTVGDKFFILQNTSATAGGTTGAFANLGGTTFSSSYATFTINYADTAGVDGIANDVSLTITAVPEPSTWAGGLLCLGLLGLTQRRRVNAWLRTARVS